MFKNQTLLWQTISFTSPFLQEPNKYQRPPSFTILDEFNWPWKGILYTSLYWTLAHNVGLVQDPRTPIGMDLEKNIIKTSFDKWGWVLRFHIFSQWRCGIFPNVNSILPSWLNYLLDSALDLYCSTSCSRSEPFLLPSMRHVDWTRVTTSVLVMRQ